MVHNYLTRPYPNIHNNVMYRKTPNLSSTLTFGFATGQIFSILELEKTPN